MKMRPLSTNALSRIAERPHMYRIALIAMAVIALTGVAMNVSHAQTPVAPPGVTAEPSIAPGMQPQMNQEKMAKMRERRKAYVEKELDTLSNRLQITASQQPIWDQYKTARLGLMPEMVQRPKPAMNAAEIAQLRAERASEMAKKLGVLSEATTHLRAALEPNQQQVLDEIAHQNGHNIWRKHEDRRAPGVGRPMGNAPMGAPTHP
ncbi:MAG TPA: Spy/CpxP family protein refolding chaperone [Halothiobacillus sp.]|nr:Spy/CpxP family protein refolding chaperone [Halothiobacillus sp.]